MLEKRALLSAIVTTLLIIVMSLVVRPGQIDFDTMLIFGGLIIVATIPSAYATEIIGADRRARGHRDDAENNMFEPIAPYFLSGAAFMGLLLVRAGVFEPIAIGVNGILFAIFGAAATALVRSLVPVDRRI